MYRGYRVVAFIPAGRRRTMEILFRYLQRFDELDEVMLWKNTDVESDIEYIEMVARVNKKFRVYEIPEGNRFYSYSSKENHGPLQWNTGRFFEYCNDPSAIYIRFDDDIVYIEDDYFRNILDFRIDNPEYWAVFGNIWNNAIISYLHQQEGRIGKEFGECSSYCMDMVGWGSGEFAEYIHNILIGKVREGKAKELYLTGGVISDDVVWNGKGYELVNGYRFSISNFAVFGRDYKEWGKFDDLDEEIWLTEVITSLTGRSNIICPNALCSHFTFSPYQKPYIMQYTDLLKRYNDLSKKEAQKDYYKGL